MTEYVPLPGQTSSPLVVVGHARLPLDGPATAYASRNRRTPGEGWLGISVGKLDEGQPDRSKFGLEVHVAGSDVEGGPGVFGLQEQA